MDRSPQPPHAPPPPRGPQPPPTTLAAMDQDELLAIRALEDLMHASTSTAASSTAAPALAATSGEPHSNPGQPIAGPSAPSPPTAAAAHDPNFVSRVSSLPVVNPLLRAYSTATGGNRVVKYVEGTLGAVGGSLIGEERRAVWDEWGCRTLDRVGLAGTPAEGEDGLRRAAIGEQDGESRLVGEEDDMRDRGRRRRPPPPPADRPPYPPTLLDATSSAAAGGYSHRPERDFAAETERAFLSTTHSTAPTSRSASASPSSRGASRSPTRDGYRESRHGTSTSLLPPASPSRRASGQGSRWSNMLVEAGMTAGGIGAAVSEESMKSLKYCLQWLQYATAHIDHQIHLLRDFLQTLSSPTTPQNALITPASLHTLSRIKADVVETIRKVVGVVSTYAGGALPEGARRRVKSLVLALPERWALANPAAGSAADGTGVDGPTISAAKAATGRVLSLAVEGLDMLSGCASVFGESLERAEMWVERLRVLGLQRAAAHQSRQQPHILPSDAAAGPQVAHTPLSLPLPASFTIARAPSAPSAATTTDSTASTPTLESNYSFLQQSVSSDATSRATGSSRTSEAEPMDADDGAGVRARAGQARRRDGGTDDDEGAKGKRDATEPAEEDGGRERGKKSRVGSGDGAALAGGGEHHLTALDGLPATHGKSAEGIKEMEMHSP